MKRTQTLEMEPQITTEKSQTPDELEAIVGLENENKIEHNSYDDESKKILEATNRLLSEDFKMPQKPNFKDLGNLPLEQKIAAMQNKKNKFEIGMADYNSKLDGKIDKTIKPLIDEVYKNAVEKAKEFTNTKNSLEEREKKYLENEKALLELFKGDFISEEDFNNDLLNLQKIKNQLEFDINYINMLSNEVKNPNTTDREAQMIQVGNFISLTDEKNETKRIKSIEIEKLINRMGQENSIKSYKDRNGIEHQGLDKIVEEADNLGVVRWVTIDKQFDSKQGKYVMLEKPKTILQAQTPEAKPLVKRYFERKSEIIADKEKHRKTEEQIKQLEQDGWIRTGKENAVKIQVIGTNGKRTYRITEVYGNPSFVKGKIYSNLPEGIIEKLNLKNKKIQNKTR